MALQDLTPQLRTRLSRMERAVGWFVLLATALLVFGFGYYVHTMAKRKGWFQNHAPFFIYVTSATGLKVGDPVMLMGFEAGEITEVKPMPADDFERNVCVKFDIKGDNIGYLWTGGSKARVIPANLLGNRVLEVTRGTGGYASFQYYPLHELTPVQARSLPEPEQWKLAEDVYVEGTNIIAVAALTPLTNLPAIFAQGRTQLWAFDTHQQLSSLTAMWDDHAGQYKPFKKHGNAPYQLSVNETPAVTEQAQELLSTVKQTLPTFIAYTNQISAALSNITLVTSNFNLALISAQPVVSNFAAISARVRESDAWAELMMGTNGYQELIGTLTTVRSAVHNADTNLIAVAENLDRNLDNLAGITSNLHAQVLANTNMLSSIADAVIHLDGMVQGLKTHWLLRSAFKTVKTNAPPVTSPKNSKSR